jgi:nitroimidazol reductase NimA-like FMN-containing flavoprotein (pyridoxamine 5'-phosphate oxidase superfamily)
MNKTEREITDKFELNNVLRNGKYTTISMCRNNEPYLVTLSYGFDEKKNALFFHAATTGLKLDFIEENPNVCATVIEDLGYVKGQCEHHFRSVVFWGKMYDLDDLDEKKHGLDILLNHLENDPDPIKQRNVKDDRKYDKVSILRLDIKEITGKQAI